VQHAAYVELRQDAVGASLYISVDARTGKYQVDDSDLRGLTGTQCAYERIHGSRR
jgi:hypothetical protein